VTSKKYRELELLYNKLQHNHENLEVKSNEQTSKLVQLNDDIARLNKELEALREQNRILKKQYDELQGMQKNLSSFSQKEMEEMLKKIQKSEESLQKKEDELREKNKRYTELQAAMEKQAEALAMLKKKVTDALIGFAGKGLSVIQKNGKIYVSVDEKLLFKSGKWDIEKPGQEALAKVSKILEQNADINIVVEGHTDSEKYMGIGTGSLVDNWDLSVKRATTVVRTLLKNTAINPARITAAGRGEYIPLVPNDTKDGKQKNRRTEIILTPKIDELLEIMNH
jgi:chemotaxis protein MotB